MGIEGAAKLGFRKELEAQHDPERRQVLFDSLVEKLYAQGSATEVASFVEIDAVIQPEETRQVILKALPVATSSRNRDRRNFVDVW